MTKRAIATLMILLLPGMALAQTSAHPPVPRDQARWFADVTDFYPAAAARAGAQGTVDYILTIDPNGRIIACRITATSGNADLDMATCKLLQKYARFDPAVDDAGKPVIGEWSKSWKWTLPR